MTTTPEQFVAAGKANLESLVELGQKTFEGVEKLVELNLQAARASFTESTDAAKALLAVKDAQELIALQQSLAQPVAEKATAYSRQVYEITSGTQAEFVKLVEAQFSAAQAQFSALVDSAVKNAPAGSEGAVAIVKQAVTAANAAIENVQKAAKQAVTAAEANFETITQSATTAAKAATSAPKARRAAV